MYPQNRHLSAKVRAFVDWVAELFSREIEAPNSRQIDRTENAAELTR
jgi:hypothetical protein